MATGSFAPKVKHSNPRAHPRASTTARKSWGSLRFHPCFLGMRNNRRGNNPQLCQETEASTRAGRAAVLCQPSGTPASTSVCHSRGTHLRQGLGVGALLRRWPRWVVGMGLGAGGSSRRGLAATLLLLLRLDGAVHHAARSIELQMGRNGAPHGHPTGQQGRQHSHGAPPGHRHPIANALCCWTSRGNFQGLAFCHGWAKPSSCSRLPELRVWHTWDSVARSPQGNQPFTLWAVKGTEHHSKAPKSSHRPREWLSLDSPARLRGLVQLPALPVARPGTTGVTMS